MKINFIKLLCMALILALMLAFVGCKNAEDKTDSSTPTSSAVDTESTNDTASTEEDLDQEDEETDEKETDEDDYDIDADEYEIDLFDKGSCKTLTESTAWDIVDQVLYMEECLMEDTERFLLQLGMDDEIKYYYGEPAPQDTDFLNTMISYEPFKNKLLTYMSENYFKSSIFNDTKYFVEFEGDLYTGPIKGNGKYESLEKMNFVEESNGKYKYAGIIESPEKRGVFITISKEKGIYVLDSIETVAMEEVAFKGYDKLNNTTAAAIIENYLVLKNYKHADICGFIEYLVNVEVQLNENKTCETKGGTLLKSNIKYKDFEKAALKYMSKTRFKNDIMKDGTIAEKDGYLYTEAFGASGEGFEVLKVKLEKEKDGKYTYLAKCVNIFYEDTRTNFEAKATIIKQNGVYVLDSIEEIKE